MRYEDNEATALRRISQAVGHGGALAISCLVSYWLITQVLTRIYFVSRDDQLLGGMWAVIATVFVYHYNYQEAVTAPLIRIKATLLGFALCLVYLMIFPFTAWGMTALIGLGAITLALVGRSEDIITAGITTTAAGITPHHPWKQPILRLVDTVVGTSVGIAGARIVRTLTHHRPTNRVTGTSVSEAGQTETHRKHPVVSDRDRLR